MNARAEQLIVALPEAGADVLLVSELVNLRYLTGYTGTNGLALIGPQTRTFITDFRYVEQAAEEVDASFERVRASQDLLDAVEAALPDGPVRLGFESAHVSVREHGLLRGLLPERVSLVGIDGAVERLRAVKNADEVARIRAATELADAAFEQVLGEGFVGRTEREVALSLELAIRERGAEGPSFETIVASGPHGALPHAKPRPERIGRDQMVVVDWGARLDGYCSDCTRTIATGQPSAVVQDVYELVLEAQLAGRAAVRAGADARAVDGVARAVIDASGHGEHFGHGLGHGVGLDIHEAPRLSQRSSDELRAGNVVTVEPGIYLPGCFGVRIEDLVVVSEDGCEVLTSVGKGLTVAD